MTLEPGFPRSKAETAGRVWTCKKGVESCTRTEPCASCRGARNRRKGKRGQHANRKALESLCDVQASWAGKLANEETADHLPLRYENKSGKSTGANAVARHYLAAENQAAAAKRVGDTRPFVATFSPDGMSDGLVVMRISQLGAVVQAIVESANRP